MIDIVCRTQLIYRFRFVYGARIRHFYRHSFPHAVYAGAGLESDTSTGTASITYAGAKPNPALLPVRDSASPRLQITVPVKRPSSNSSKLLSVFSIPRISLSISISSSSQASAVYQPERCHSLRITSSKSPNSTNSSISSISPIDHPV